VQAPGLLFSFFIEINMGVMIVYEVYSEGAPYKIRPLAFPSNKTTFCWLLTHVC
jgi:hypothetical protein